MSDILLSAQVRLQTALYRFAIGRKVRASSSTA